MYKYSIDTDCTYVYVYIDKYINTYIHTVYVCNMRLFMQANPWSCTSMECILFFLYIPRCGPLRSRCLHLQTTCSSILHKLRNKIPIRNRIMIYSLKYLSPTPSQNIDQLIEFYWNNLSPQKMFRIVFAHMWRQKEHLTHSALLGSATRAEAPHCPNGAAHPASPEAQWKHESHSKPLF